MTIVQPKLLVVGDYCVDETLTVEPGKQNPENSSPLYNIISLESGAGMSANVVECLDSLGLQNITYIKSSSSPIKKTRIYCSSGTPVCRLDEDLIQKPVNLDGIDLSKYDCIIVSDYNKGAVTDETIHKILKESKSPVFLDTKKKNLGDFEGCIIKVNELEFSSATSLPNHNLIVTLGDRGCTYGGKHWPTNKVSVKDVCGAGDAFLAGLVYGWLKHRNLDNSIKYGLANATISVQYLGCYRPSEKELLEAI